MRKRKNLLKKIWKSADRQSQWPKEGLLKSYADKRNGWIKLIYTEKL